MNYLGHWVASTFQNNNLDYKNSKLRGEIKELEDKNKRLTQDLQRKEKDYKKQVEELKEENRKLTMELRRREFSKPIPVELKTQELQKNKLSKPVIVEPKTEEIVREIVEFKLPEHKPTSIRLRDYFGIRIID